MTFDDMVEERVIIRLEEVRAEEYEKYRRRLKEIEERHTKKREKWEKELEMLKEERARLRDETRILSSHGASSPARP